MTLATARVAAETLPADEATTEGLGGDAAAVLRAMARARTAAPLLSELLDALPGWSKDRLQDALAEAEVAGLIDPWPDCPAGVAVVLSNLAADRLGLRLAGRDEGVRGVGRFGLRWISARSRPRPPRLERRGAALVLLEADLGSPDAPASLDDLEDPKVTDSVEHAAGLEWFEERRQSTERGRGWTPQELLARGWLRFIHLVGVRERWDGELIGDVVCPSCLGRPLAELEACVRCNRSGLDDLLGPPPKVRRPKADKPGSGKGAAKKGPTGAGAKAGRRKGRAKAGG